MELKILDAIQNIRTPLLDDIMVGITTLGNGGAIWIILTAVLLICPKTRKIGAAMAAAIAIEALCCNAILKPLVARVRPCDVNTGIQLLISRPTDFSFPSGHTGIAFASATALFYEKSRLRIPAAVLAVLISFSRLYLYVHYPSDVITAAMLGIMLGCLGAFISNKLLEKYGTLKSSL